MNQTRRDILKAMMLAPVAGISAAASERPKPLVLTGGQVAPISTVRCGVTVRHFVLAIPVDVSRQFFDAIHNVLGRENSEPYRGFAPGDLRVVGFEIPESDSGRMSRINFDARVAYTAVGELREVHDIINELEQRNRVSFAELPGGEWRELPSSFEYSVVYSNSLGDVIA